MRKKTVKQSQWYGTPVRKVEYVGYAMGMIGYQLQATIVSIYLLMFMTNILEIPMMYAGSVTLVCRFVDAFTDIFFGTIGDRTHTQWGSFRPWYVTLAIPAAISFFLMFTCPSFVTPGSAFALFWIYFIYLIYGSVFTTIMFTSYNSFTSVVTSEQNERSKLVIARQIGMNISNVLIATAVPIMTYFGDGVTNNKAAFMGLGIYIAAVSGICYLVCGISMRERITLNAGKPVPIKESFKVFKGNRIFAGALISNILYSIAMNMFAAMSGYYYLYYKMNSGLMSKAQLAAGLVSTAVGFLILPLMMKKLKRVTVFVIGVVVWVGLLIVGYFLAMFDISAYLMNIGTGIGIMIAYAVTYTYVPDAVDYGEWSNGVYAPGTVNTVMTFIQKITTGFGTVLTSAILSMVGYEAALGFEQAESTKEGIRLAICIVPAGFFLASVIGMIILRTVKAEQMKKIRRELEERRIKTKEA